MVEIFPAMEAKLWLYRLFIWISNVFFYDIHVLHLKVLSFFVKLTNANIIYNCIWKELILSKQIIQRFSENTNLGYMKKNNWISKIWYLNIAWHYIWCKSLLFMCRFSFDHCVVCPFSIYRFWLPPFGIFKLFVFS